MKVKHHEDSHLVPFPVERGMTFRRRKGHEYCAIITMAYRKVAMCEYVAANTTEEVFSRDMDVHEFIKEFEPTELGLKEVHTMLVNRAERAGATERAQYLLKSLTAWIEEGAIQMATKKSPAKSAAKTTPAKTSKSSAKPAAKPAPVQDAAGPGRKSSFTPDMKISVLVKENPKRADAARRFDLYKDNKTVSEYLAAGGTMADIRWDVKQSFIAVK